MPIAGAAAGANSALEQALDRRLREEIAQQQAEEAKATLAQRAIEEDRRAKEADAAQKFRQGQVDRQDAEDTYTHATPGDISPEMAASIRKSPGLAPLVTERKIIQGVRPIAPGIGAMDESGPQSFNVLEPTQAQAEGQYKKIRLKDISKILSGATTEQQRRAVGAQALGEGLEVPNNLLAQTGEEKLKQTLADEGRDEATWERRNNITNAQANARQAQSDKLMRDRAGEARDDKPPTSAQTTLGAYASRLEQAEPSINDVEAEIAKMHPASFETQMWMDRPSFQSKTMQKYMQASRNMINAVLRRESGAVISPTEFAEARQQYLPQPGDTDEVLAMKRQNRALNFSNYRKGAGKAYQSLDDALGSGGESKDDLADMVYNPATGKIEKKKK